MLLIEDDVELCELMREYFACAGFASRRFTTDAADWQRPLTALTI